MNAFEDSRFCTLLLTVSLKQIILKVISVKRGTWNFSPFTFQNRVLVVIIMLKDREPLICVVLGELGRVGGKMKNCAAYKW